MTTNETISLTMNREVLQETVIALRDRRLTLRREVNTEPNEIIREIAKRQLARVDLAIDAFIAWGV